MLRGDQPGEKCTFRGSEHFGIRVAFPPISPFRWLLRRSLIIAQKFDLMLINPDSSLSAWPS
jgi:hypothetical protein